MERKKFLRVVASGATALVVPMGLYNCSDTPSDRSLATPLLLSTIWDAQTISAMGERYLRQYPQENTEQKLVELLTEDVSRKQSDFLESISSRIKEDYKPGKTVTLDGWILSVTECRQCALFSLTRSR